MADSSEQNKTLPYIPGIEGIIEGDFPAHHLAFMSKNKAFYNIRSFIHGGADNKKLDAFVETLQPFVRTKLNQLASEPGEENLSEKVAKQYGKSEDKESLFGEIIKIYRRDAEPFLPIRDYLEQRDDLSPDEKTILLNFASLGMLDNHGTSWPGDVVANDLESIIEYSADKSAGDLESGSTLAKKLDVYKAARAGTLNVEELGQEDRKTALDGAIAGEHEALIKALSRQNASTYIVPRIKDFLDAGKTASALTLIKMAPEIQNADENESKSIVAELIYSAIYKSDENRLGQLLEIARTLELQLDSSELTQAFRGEPQGKMLELVVDYLAEHGEIEALPTEDAVNLLKAAFHAKDENVMALFVDRASEKDLQSFFTENDAPPGVRLMSRESCRMVLEQLHERGWPVDLKTPLSYIQQRGHEYYEIADEICAFAKEHDIFIDFKKMRHGKDSSVLGSSQFLSSIKAPEQIKGLIKALTDYEKKSVGPLCYPTAARVERAELEQALDGRTATIPEVGHVQRQDAKKYLSGIDLETVEPHARLKIPKGLAPAIAVELSNAGIGKKPHKLTTDELHIKKELLEDVQEALKGRNR